jgi:hypothetical protein
MIYARFTRVAHTQNHKSSAYKLSGKTESLRNCRVYGITLLLKLKRPKCQNARTSAPKCFDRGYYNGSYSHNLVYSLSRSWLICSIAQPK